MCSDVPFTNEPALRAKSFVEDENSQLASGKIFGRSCLVYTDRSGTLFWWAHQVGNHMQGQIRLMPLDERRKGGGGGILSECSGDVGTEKRVNRIESE